MINVLDRITHYRTQKGWTEYQLAVESGLTQSTISSWYRKQLVPSIPSLEKICAAFGITLAQFFSEEENTFALTPVQQHLIETSVGSKDTPPSSVFAVYTELEKDEPRRQFTIGIVDDVTNLSLPEVPAPNTAAPGTIECKFWGLGGDGTVGANKNSIKIIGDHTDKYVQAYFQYDSKKTGGVTISHLRFGDSPIRSPYYVNKADFVACHNPAYLGKYDMVHDIKPGGIFLLNCGWSMEELERRFTGDGKAYLAKNNIHLYTIDADAIGKELGLGGRVNTVLQAAFFRLTGIIPEEDALQFMKDAATRAYGAKGDDIVAMNHAAIERGFTDAREVPIPAHCATQRGDFVSFYATGRDPELVEYVNRIQIPADLQKGDDLPVSTFLGRDNRGGGVL